MSRWRGLNATCQDAEACYTGGMADSLDHLADLQSAHRNLREIPGVGPVVANALIRLGMRRVADLAGKSPEALYAQLEALEGAPVDRCALYTLRCAVYYAETERPDPDKLKWWKWKDELPK